MSKHQLEITPLGTSAAVPALGRHFSALTVLHKPTGTLTLFDCGEGTQFQLLASQARLSKLSAIFITHLHGDHYYGLPGLLSTLGMLQYDKPISLIGPEGLRAFLEDTVMRHLPYELNVIEIKPDFKPGVVFETPQIRISAGRLEHRVFAIGYRYETLPLPGNLDVEKARNLGITDYRDYQRLKRGDAVITPEGVRIEASTVVGPEKPGVVFSYVTDSKPCPGGKKLATGADLLYHEATYMEKDAQAAAERGHSTTIGAAQLAKEAGVGSLMISHFSARYRDIEPLVEEARTCFPNAFAAEELKSYPL